MEIAVLIGGLIILRFGIKNSRTYKLLLAILFIVLALPAGMFAEVGLNGCCGSPSTGNEGSGYIVTVLLFATGVTLGIQTIKSSKKKN